MGFLFDRALTANIFGGIDIPWLALIIVAVAAIGIAVFYGCSVKKGCSKRKTGLISAVIGVVALLGSCAYSVISDSTPAVTTDSYITIFGLTVHIDRAAFEFNIGDGFTVYWYGIIIGVGFLLALVYGFRSAKRFGIDPDRMMDVVICGLIAAVIGARTYYLAFDGQGLASFKDFFKIHDGGMAIYGGIIGAFVVGGIVCKIRKVNILSMFDLASLGFLIGQGVGRWGNFVNQEVYGVETGSTWFGMTGSTIAYETGSTALVHPTFLYESLWCLIAFFILNHISKKRAFNGQTVTLYMMIYGAGRFVFEGMRNTGFILMLGKSISISQLVSVIAVVAGGVLYAVLYARSKTLKAAAYEGQFAERFDDTDMLESAYNLLGVEWDCSDDELEAAYSDKRGFFSSVEADGDDRQAKVAAKLDELEKAYDYIVNSRRLEAEEDGEADDSAESEAAVAESGTAEGDSAEIPAGGGSAEIPAEGDTDDSGTDGDTDGSGTDGAEG